MKLICFPYAGAASVAYMQWKKYFDGIEIIPIDLPGRGRRISEPLCETIKEMVDDVKVQILELVNREEKYAVYGHSMGTLLIYGLLHDLLKMGFPMPVHIFLSGKNPPHIPSKKPINQLNDEKFIEKIVGMGGMEACCFENPMLAKIFLPIFRADFKIVENYQYKKNNRPFPVDISFFFASDDACVDRQYVKQWADFTTGSFRMYYFMGGHFFLFEHGEQIAKIIRETLANVYEVIPY